MRGKVGGTPTRPFLSLYVLLNWVSFQETFISVQTSRRCGMAFVAMHAMSANGGGIAASVTQRTFARTLDRSTIALHMCLNKETSLQGNYLLNVRTRTGGCLTNTVQRHGSHSTARVRARATLARVATANLVLGS